MIQRFRYFLRTVALATAALFALPQAAEAHGRRPPWLDATALDDGLHVVVQHPRVVRTPSPLNIKVVLRNMAGEHDVTIERVRYISPDGEVAEVRGLGRTLPTKRTTFEQFKATRAEMHDLAHRGDIEGVERLANQCAGMLEKLTADVLIDRFRVPVEEIHAQGNALFQMAVEIELVEQGERRIIRRPIEISIQQPLPNGSEVPSHWRYDARTGALWTWEELPPARGAGESVVWYAGDQHLHTTYSLDAVILDGTVEDVTDYATTAESIGLDWIIVTDHSNVHYNHQGTEYYTPEQFDAGTAQAAAYTAGNALVALYGEEMGAGRAGLFNLPSHYLAYPFASASTGYLANPSSGLIYGLANCEDEQVIIDRVNGAGGFGFIAHPFDSGTLAFAQWDFNNGATGWSGFEIWSDTNGQIKSTDDQALSKWHELLNAIPAPQQGVLSDRPDFPNAFPVGLGNSDAHQPGLIGATFTYAWMPAFSRAEVVGALMAGRCVASNGPLLFGEINGAPIGEVAFLLDADNDLDLTLTTSGEFGPVGDYQLAVYVDGAVRTTLPPSGDPGYSMAVGLDGLNLSAPDKFVTMRADSSDGLHHAITNPIWLQFTSPGDADADGLIALTDFTALADCTTGPEIERSPSCDIMDFDRDRDVDLIDFAMFQPAFTGSGD